METGHRTRNGALLGAIAGPPLLILGTNPLIQPHMADSAKVGSFPWWMVAHIACWIAAFIGLPFLGVSIAAGGWIGRIPGRRLANYCIGGAFGGAILSTIVGEFLGRVAHAFAVGAGGTVLRLSIAEACLVVAVLLCFREAKAPPPA